MRVAVEHGERLSLNLSVRGRSVWRHVWWLGSWTSHSGRCSHPLVFNSVSDLGSLADTTRLGFRDTGQARLLVLFMIFWCSSVCTDGNLVACGEQG
jgi:hypothetical protein